MTTRAIRKLASRLVAAAPRADRDERHSVRPGDRLADRFGIEAHERAALHRHFLAVDVPDAGAFDHDVDLLLLRLALVVLLALGAGGSSNQLIPNASTPSSRRAKRTTPQTASRSSMLTVE